MTTALKAPENRVEIFKALVWLHDSIARAALVYGVTSGVLHNLLNGKTPPSEKHQLIVAQINADTGADMKAWEK